MRFLLKYLPSLLVGSNCLSLYIKLFNVSQSSFPSLICNDLVELITRFNIEKRFSSAWLQGLLYCIKDIVEQPFQPRDVGDCFRVHPNNACCVNQVLTICRFTGICMFLLLGKIFGLSFKAQLVFYIIARMI